MEAGQFFDDPMAKVRLGRFALQILISLRP
jgi:hypothetical protein